jgi:hypothetical protein
MPIAKLANESMISALLDRRRFLVHSVASAGASALAAACGSATSEAKVDAGSPSDTDTASDIGTSSDIPCAPQSVPDNPDAGLSFANLPYRQDDPLWGGELMWNRDLVIQAATQLNGETKKDAEALLRKFPDGNSIANEGCMLTCLAMVLKLLVPAASPSWTPGLLNQTAQEYYYYSPCGLSMTTLYADLVSDVSEGQVQLCLKEEYLPGVPYWPRVHAHTAALLRAYRSLTPAQRSQFVVMLKTGTYDDTVASHYVLLHPSDAGGADDANPQLLDPAMPLDKQGIWRLTDSAATITQDPDIAAGWQQDGIEPTQIAGVWVFVRWRPDRSRSFVAPLVAAWATELAKIA